MEGFEQFSQAVGCLYRDMQKLQRAEMAKYGLKGIHAECLLAMLRYPEGMTCARLGRLCDKDKAAISRTVSELERQGLISRQENNGVRYRAVLHLTEQGTAAAGAVRAASMGRVKQAGEAMSAESRRSFCENADLLARNLHTLCTREMR